MPCRCREPVKWSKILGFWTSDKIIDRMDQICTEAEANQVKHNSVELRIGSEVYVSPNRSEETTPPKEAIRRLEAREYFTIPAGQFAFLETLEKVNVPTNAMAFISIKSRVKLQGLVNVSGFHVDPGHHGKLVFGVFNAGPQSIMLRQGAETFLIWFADLSGTDTDGSVSTRNRLVNKGQRSNDGIDPFEVANVAGSIDTFAGIRGRIDEVKDDLDSRFRTIEREHAVFRWTSTILAGALIGLLIRGVF